MRFTATILFTVAAVVCAAALVRADWTTDATSLILAKPGFENHVVDVRMTLGNPDGFFGLQLPAAGVNDQYDTGAYCIDLEHGIQPGLYETMTWLNLNDLNDTITCLSNITVDEPSYAPHNCTLTDPAVYADSTDPTVLPNIDDQFALTADWCDVRRILKYRRSIIWLMENLDLFVGTHAGSSYPLCEVKRNTNHVQAAMWWIIENDPEAVSFLSNIGDGIGQTLQEGIACARSIVEAALVHNTDDYTEPCDGATSTTVTKTLPVILKDPTCLDGKTSTECMQYLLADLHVDYTCDPVDFFNECVCKEYTMSCLTNNNELHFDANSNCGCVTFKEDVVAGQCDVSDADCPAGY